MHASAAALHMRTLVDGVKGELFERARIAKGEKMDWALMSARLGSDALRAVSLRNQETFREALYKDLSGTAKLRGVGSPDDLWSRTLDHLLVVLGESDALG